MLIMVKFENKRWQVVVIKLELFMVLHHFMGTQDCLIIGFLSLKYTNIISKPFKYRLRVISITPSILTLFNLGFDAILNPPNLVHIINSKALLIHFTLSLVRDESIVFI
jgi:hypothetical protein